MSSLTAAGGSTQVRALKHTGISLPPANLWKVGTSWSETSRLEETIAIGGKVGSPLQVRVDETDKIVAQEPVQVPAGTFTALRVDSTFVEHLGGTNISISSSSWYAQGVGQIKVAANAAAGAGGGATTIAELVSYTP